MYRHGREAEFPYRKTMLAIAIGRCLSMLLGWLTVLMVYRTALLIDPRSERTALFAASLTALNPMFLAVSNSVNNDNLVVALSAATLYCAVYLHGAPLRWRGVLLLGLFSAAAIWAKLSGLVVAVLGLFALLTGESIPQRRRTTTLFYLLTVVILTGGLFISNSQRFGHPLAIGLHAELAGNARAALDPLAIFREWSGFFKSYWGVFGAFNIVFPDWTYRLFAVITGAGLGSYLIASARRRVLPAYRILLGLVIINFLAVAVWTALLTGSQGRLMFPSLGAISLLTAAGFGTLPSRLSGVLMAMTSGFLLLMNLWAALGIIPGSYR